MEVRGEDGGGAGRGRMTMKGGRDVCDKDPVLISCGKTDHLRPSFS